MKCAELIERWESILYDLNCEEFNLDKFKEVAKDTLEVVLPELKENKNVAMDSLKLLIKMTRFSERELYSNEQEAAQYFINEILYAAENGPAVLDIDDNNVLYMFAPNSFDRIGIDLNVFDFKDLISCFPAF